MADMFEFFSLREALPLAALIWLLAFVGGLMEGGRAVGRCARGGAAAAFLLYAGVGIERLRPATPTDCLALTARALLAMGVAHGAVRVTMPAMYYLYTAFWAEPLARSRERAADKAREDARVAAEHAAAEHAEAAARRRAEEEHRRQQELASVPPPPPPPTREELAAAAHERYAARERIIDAAPLDETEKAAGRAEAKKKLLKDLDGALRHDPVQRD